MASQVIKSVMAFSTVSLMLAGCSIGPFGTNQLRTEYREAIAESWSNQSEGERAEMCLEIAYTADDAAFNVENDEAVDPKWKALAPDDVRQIVTEFLEENCPK